MYIIVYNLRNISYIVILSLYPHDLTPKNKAWWNDINIYQPSPENPPSMLDFSWLLSFPTAPVAATPAAALVPAADEGRLPRQPCPGGTAGAPGRGC